MLIFQNSEPLFYKMDSNSRSSENEPRLKRTWKIRYRTRSDPFWNIFAGSFGGISSLVVGYPLDTIKVRLQTQTCGNGVLQYRSAFDCFRQIVASDGLRSLFRGMSAPAIFATPRFALIFHANAHILNSVRGKFGKRFDRIGMFYVNCCMLLQAK